MKNLAGFIFPHTTWRETHPVLHLNFRRRTFGGVCNTPLHGYVKNPPGFIFPHPNAPKTHPISPSPIRMRPKTHPVLHPNRRRGAFRGVCFCAPTRVRAKPARFHISAPEYAKNAPDFTLPNKDIPKTCPILDPNLWRETFGGVCFCAPTQVHQKPGGFWTLPLDMARNPAGFGLCHSTWHETQRVLDFATRHGTKPSGFWTLPLDMAQNLAGFGLCHTT